MNPYDPATYAAPAGSPPPETPREQPRKKRHVVRWILAGLGAFILLIVVISIVASPKKGTPAVAPQQSASSAPATKAAAPVAVVPSPNGTYQGACDYTLGNDPAGGTAVATGDIETTNTGNIGTVIKLTLTWPQQGFSPLSETKTVRLAAGGSQDVQFNMPLTSDQLDNLQNWQLSHAGDDGCTYNGTISSTFGTAH